MERNENLIANIKTLIPSIMNIHYYPSQYGNDLGPGPS